MKLLHLKLVAVLCLVPICLGFGGSLRAQESAVNAGADIMSRYIWRGLDFGDAASIQPSLKLGYGGFAAGFWGSYSSEFEEIDTWASYSHAIPNSVTLTALVTDYYFPQAGIGYFNFNNYDDPEGSGAHVLELGLTVAGPEQFPLSISGFYNVYNDAGNNAYFQLDYATKLDGTTIGSWIGVAVGSEEAPEYYGTDNLEVINIGIKGTRPLKLWQDTELPLSVSFIVNPNQEISYLILGVSL